MNARGLEFVHKQSVDLGEVPWLPVNFLDGTTKKVGFREFFSKAHLIEDFEVDSPAVWYSLYRYMSNLTYFLEEDVDNGRFSDESLAALFDRFENFWWLFHPEHPFLQNIQLLQYSGRTETADLDWQLWTKMRSDVKEYDDVLDVTTITLALFYRHYFDLPNNTGPVCPPDAVAYNRTEGGLAYAGPRNLTHVIPFPKYGGSFFDVLMHSLHFAIKEDVLVDSRTFFEDPNCSDPKVEGSRLWLLGYSASSSYLQQDPVTLGSSGLFLRGPSPHDKEKVTALVTAARLGDPHTIKFLVKDQVGNSLKDVKYAYLPATTVAVQNTVNLFLTDQNRKGSGSTAPRLHEPNFLSGKKLRANLLSIETAGTATSPVLSAVTLSSVSIPVTLFQQEYAKNVERFISLLAGSKGSYLSTLKYHAREACLGRDVGANVGVVWWGYVGEFIDTALGEVAANPAVLKDSAWKSGKYSDLSKLTLKAYDSFTYDRTVSVKELASIAKHRSMLGAKLWKIVKSDT